jgi:hypothetical protein
MNLTDEEKKEKSKPVIIAITEQCDRLSYTGAYLMSPKKAKKLKDKIEENNCYDEVEIKEWDGKSRFVVVSYGYDSSIPGSYTSIHGQFETKDEAEDEYDDIIEKSDDYDEWGDYCGDDLDNEYYWVMKIETTRAKSRYVKLFERMEMGA